jgi:hypothetical protein
MATTLLNSTYTIQGKKKDTYLYTVTFLADGTGTVKTSDPDRDKKYPPSIKWSQVFNGFYAFKLEISFNKLPGKFEALGQFGLFPVTGVWASIDGSGSIDAFGQIEMKLVS